MESTLIPLFWFKFSVFLCILQLVYLFVERYFPLSSLWKNFPNRRKRHDLWWSNCQKETKIAQRQTRPYLWWMDKRALLFQCMQDMGLDLDFSSYSRGTSIILPSYFKLLWCLLQLTCWGDCQIEKITLLLAHDNISWIKTASAASVACSTAFYFQGHPPRTQFTYNNCLVINNVLLDMLLNRISIGNWYYLLQAVIHIAGLLLSCKQY